MGGVFDHLFYDWRALFTLSAIVARYLIIRPAALRCRTNLFSDIRPLVSQFYSYMDSRTFFKWLIAITLGTMGVLAGLHFLLPEMQAHWKFAVASLVLFVLICIGLFFAGSGAIRSKSRVAFINLVSASVFGKMLLAVAFLFIYQRIAKPENEWFVGTFLLCYVVFTGFEVWFMTRLART